MLAAEGGAVRYTVLAHQCVCSSLSALCCSKAESGIRSTFTERAFQLKKHVQKQQFQLYSLVNIYLLCSKQVSLTCKRLGEISLCFRHSLSSLQCSGSHPHARCYVGLWLLPALSLSLSTHLLPSHCLAHFRQQITGNQNAGCAQTACLFRYLFCTTHQELKEKKTFGF